MHTVRTAPRNTHVFIASWCHVQGTIYSQQKMCTDPGVKKFMNTPVDFVGKGKGKGRGKSKSRGKGRGKTSAKKPSVGA